MSTNPAIITIIEVPVLEEVFPAVKNNQSHVVEDYEDEEIEDIEIDYEVARITLTSVQKELYVDGTTLVMAKKGVLVLDKENQ